MAKLDAGLKANQAAFKAKAVQVEGKKKKREEEAASIKAQQEQARALRAAGDMTSPGGEEGGGHADSEGLRFSLVASQSQERIEMAALLSVVQALVPPPHEGGCPWVATQTCRQLLRYLRSEVEEVAVELDQIIDQSGSPLPEPGVAAAATRRLHQELGDLAFDCLLLVALAQRDHPAARQPRGPYQLAALKIQERTPYMSLWGGQGGETAKDSGEAQAHWQRVKAKQKAREAEEEEAFGGEGSPLPPVPLPGVSWFVFIAKGAVVLGSLAGLAYHMEVHRHPKLMEVQGTISKAVAATRST